MCHVKHPRSSKVAMVNKESNPLHSQQCITLQGKGALALPLSSTHSMICHIHCFNDDSTKLIVYLLIGVSSWIVLKWSLPHIILYYKCLLSLVSDKLIIIPLILWNYHYLFPLTKCKLSSLSDETCKCCLVRWHDHLILMSHNTNDLKVSYKRHDTYAYSSLVLLMSHKILTN